MTRASRSGTYLCCSHVLKDIIALKEPAMPLSFLVLLEATTQKRAWTAKLAVFSVQSDTFAHL